MSSFSQKYAIVQFFDTMPVGFEFRSSDWLLHSTIVDTFATDWSAAMLASKLKELLRHCRPVESSVIGEDFFGPTKQVRVMLLEKTSDLSALHHNVLTLLEEGNLRLNDPQYARDGFRPHSTVQGHRRLDGGEVVRFDALSLVDMFPGGDPYARKIIATIRLSG